VIIQITEAKDNPKRQELRKQINGKFNNTDSADGNKRNITAAILPLSEAEIQGLLHQD
jgi:hypothetical protein